MVEFPPCYPEELHKFALRYGNFAIPLAINLHSISPVEITALIGYAYFSFGIIDCLHAVSSILQITISEGSQVSISAMLPDYQLLMKFTLNFTPKNVKLGVFFFILVRIHTLHIYTWTHCWEQQTY